MNKQKRTYMQMQLEEASVDSGRYNTDYIVQSRPAGPATLLNAFRSTAARLGTEFNLPSVGKLGVANLRNSNKN
ncbi:MAG: hypothetical protein WD740_06995 [Anaerolineales bacterium]